ncbi:MAG: hypothetical protein U1F43_30610 [Myxococcota bacterium]
MTLLRALALTPLLAFSGLGCDSNGDGTDGSLTDCSLNFTVTNVNGKDFGASCSTGSDCKFGVCMKPGDKGNITNNQFGFCTRGCDCENDPAAQIPDDQKEGGLECVYPSDGAGTLKTFHFVAVECTDLAECQSIDPAWTSCEIPDTGSARKVCHAL